MSISKNIPKAKCSDPLIGFQRQALKTKSYIFCKTLSMSIKSEMQKSSIKKSIEQFDEKGFRPKLQSKQLLREPKFFFSLERRKIKNQQSQPSFDEPKLQNPEMKGSKSKALYAKMMMTRKQGIQQCLKVENRTFYRNKSYHERQKTTESQFEKVAQIFALQRIQDKLQKCFPNQTTLEVKMMKRPNLYENISFLIRRKREMKNRSMMNKLSKSKKVMTQEIFKTEEEAI